MVFLLTAGPTLGCTRLAEHVEPKQAPVELRLADISGDWRVSCTKYLLLGQAEGVPVYVQMRIVIPLDGRAESGAIVGYTQFKDALCEGAGVYEARSVSYALERAEVSDEVYVLQATLEDSGPEEPFSPTRFVALTADPDAGLMMLDIDGEADRAPLTEPPTDPDEAWGWFAEDPDGRGVMAVRFADAPEVQ